MKTLAAVLGALLLVTAVTALSDTPGATLDKATVPAVGRQEALLRVSRFGRYAIGVESPQGTALQMIDRMSGPGPVAGEAGKRDGRLDVFLERGNYKLITLAHPEGDGTASLRVDGFVERNAPEPPRLVEYKPVETTLRDLEIRSYWLQIDRRRWVAIEAAGRNLADLRLWKDGDWLVDAEPAQAIVEAIPGAPLQVRRLAALLNPGLYLLSAYGTFKPWAEHPDSHPLYLRFGVPELAAAGRRYFVASPFGIDRWRVPKSADYFRLELPEAAAASLRVTDYSERDPFSAAGSEAVIGKDSRLPVAELETGSSGDGFYLVTVEREAGRPYVLQHFQATEEYRFEGDGDYWLDLLSSSQAGDTVPATTLLVGQPAGTGDPTRKKLIEAGAIELDKNTGWRGRFNLPALATLFLEVIEGGEYRIGGEGALYRVEPFFLNPPEDYEPPPARPGGRAWTLDSGFYVLSVEPLAPGILDLRIRAQGQTAVESTAAPAVRFSRLPLWSDWRYTLYVNQRPETKTGIVLRRLPIDLSRALPVTPDAGETLEIPVWLPARGSISARDQHGAYLPLAVDRGAWKQTEQTTPDRHRLRIRNPSDRPAQISLAFAPLRLAAETPLPALSRAPVPPVFPELRAAEPRYLDLQRREQRTFAVRVEQPGLYRLQSAGLLETEGNLRTRVQPSLSRQQANGVGRNFLIQEYLDAGDYQLSLSAQGKTRGHLGLNLDRTILHERGVLQPNLPARATLSAGDGLAYRFEIIDPGRYRLRALGLERNLRLRLEDEAGWPLTAPGRAEAIGRHFEPGRYRAIVLPEPVPTRVVAILEPVPEPKAFEGHGPHPLALGEKINHVWLEPEAGGERLPDVWRFSLPAPIDATISLSGEMQGMVFKREGKKQPVAVVRLRRAWEGRLQAGFYRLEVKNSRRDNRAPYELEIKAAELIPGQSRSLTVPAEVPVSVGREGLVQLASEGIEDVEARLYDQQGTLLAYNDDRADDWNFLIARALAPGFYRLQIDPVGRESAVVRVGMQQPEEIADAVLKPAARRILAGDKVHLVPLEPPPPEQGLLVTARAAAGVGLSLERKIAGQDWRIEKTVQSAAPRIALAPGADAAYRLRIWPLDGSGQPIELSAAALSPLAVAEATLTDMGFTAPAEAETGLALLAVRLERPGFFEFEPAASPVQWAVMAGHVFSAEDGLIGASQEKLWLLAEAGTRLQLRRARLPATGAMALDLPAGRAVRLDLAPADEGLLLVVAEAEGGQPGLAWGSGDRAAAMGLAGGSTAVVGLQVDRQSAVRLWNAADADKPLSVRVRQYRYRTPAAVPLAWGRHDLGVAGALALRLPPGQKNLRLSLPADTAAVLASGEKLLNTFWSGEAPLALSLDSSAERLLLFSANGAPPAGVELTPAAQEPRTLTAALPLRFYFASEGVFYLPYRLDGASAEVGMLGADAEAVLLDAAGQVRRGRRLAATADGLLLIRHGVGLCAVWLAAELQNPLGALARENVMAVEAPATVDLKGRVMSLTLRQDRPVLLNLQAPLPMLAQVQPPDGPAELRLFAEGVDLNAYLAAGASTITLLPAAGEKLSGVARLFTSEMTPLGEGLGEAVQLAPGDSRLFSFSVKRKRTVGVGVRAAADIVTTRLFDRYGGVIGEGVVQMHELAPGVFLLAIEAPADGPPVTARPAVVGIEPPDSGPPPAVVREYLERAGLKPAD